MKARIHGVTLDGTDSTNSPYTITSIDGWDDGVETRREAIDRPAAHGQFPTPGYLSGRLITINGEIYTSSPSEQDHAILRLTGLLADGSTAKFAVETALGSQWASVQRNGPPDIVRDRWGLLATYQLQFWAADPRKYGEVREYAAGEEAVQYGNFPATPKIIVNGIAESGYTVTGPGGRRVIVYHPLTAAVPHTIDFTTGGLYVAGQRIFGAITVYEPWTVSPGLPGVVTTVNGARTLRIQVADTFV
ncbi:hypothetical protein [Microbacterium sp.]|uniref:hypothetical protein n=1 Tax=Microbacterium sp. TaxID=51671 RepID=UPI002810D76C|nr:hypothetical protein [Microbacterium sp.]